MNTNVGGFDGAFRSFLFVLAICYAIIAGGSAWLWVIPGAILFGTAIVSTCPVYLMLGLSTDKKK